MKDRGQGTYALNTSVQLNQQIVGDVSCIKPRDSHALIWRHISSNPARVLTRILKTGFIESIPGKSWSQN